MSHRFGDLATALYGVVAVLSLASTDIHGDNSDSITARCRNLHWKSGSVHYLTPLSGDVHKYSLSTRSFHMEPEHQDYKGHHIELRARDVGELRAPGVEREPELELLIDDKPVRYGQLPDGSYALHEYAYDWSDNLMDLAKRFIDYRDRADKIRREAEPSEGK
jgi:hypothetical protein